MEPYAELSYSLYTKNVYKLDFKIKQDKLTTMNFASFIDEFQTILKGLKDNKIEKFIMIYDFNNLDYNINNSQINEITHLFKENSHLFKEKLLGTFIIAHNNIVTTFIKLFKSIYTPIKPLFLNIDIDIVIEDLINNVDTKQEYKL
tara:strand:+ start:157 stop:594 length:438 start_codon:yes stop_codon:yes gene_type:complete